MKALQGDVAKKLRSTQEGRKALQEFLVSQKDEQVVTLSDGTSFVISRKK